MPHTGSTVLSRGAPLMRRASKSATCSVMPLSVRLFSGTNSISGRPSAALRSSGVTMSWCGPASASRRDETLTVAPTRSEEHTSELQSRFDLVCRLLLEKKKYKKKYDDA